MYYYHLKCTFVCIVATIFFVLFITSPTFTADIGTEKWNFSTGGKVISSPTVADGTVYVGSRDGRVYALRTDHSKPSEGSRVLLGTIGHHNSFAEQGPTQPELGTDETLGVRARLRELERETNGLQNSYDSLNGRVEKLRTGTKELEGEVDRLTERIENLRE